MKFNKIKFSIALFSLALVLFAADTVFAAYGPVQDFTLINRTGDTIVSIFLSPTRANKWRAEDELGDYVLKHGYEIEIEFSPWEDARYWDLRAEFADGTYDEWYNFDLFSISEITLRRNGDAVYR
ncbi:MAG: hypothetical protein IJT20_01825 [Synergistaceae bacterium]|nr:hypothetical protein [Synergistaceae bacterium]